MSGSRGVTREPSRLSVVAPEVAEQIVARRAAGDGVAVIGRDLHMTPGEVLGVIRAEERGTCPADRGSPVRRGRPGAVAGPSRLVQVLHPAGQRPARVSSSVTGVPTAPRGRGGLPRMVGQG